MMAKLYGARWRLVDGPELGRGGQGKVLRVVDTTGEHQGEFALKRVKYRKRDDRFRREIAAVTLLRHRNIISLVDHSALHDTNSGVFTEQFLVMPIAKNGNLSKRVNLYKDDISGTLLVAKRLADALRVAHAAGVIHRDVKPQNILFNADDHEPWLADFGICLLREEYRITESNEIVGPRRFMAPEIEGGGRLDVPPAVDVYSLGKVIYYMITGGIVFARERLDEDQYRRVFDRGERYGRLELLLQRMICPIEQRIGGMEEVIEELERIEVWEQRARLLPISHPALADLERLQRRSIEAGRIAVANEQAHRHEREVLASVQKSLTGWLTAQLNGLASIISSVNIRCEVRDAEMPQGGQLVVQTGQNAAYSALNGVELVYADQNDAVGRVHGLSFFVCREDSVSITAHSMSGTTSPALETARDVGLALLPFYRQTRHHLHPAAYSAAGYLNHRSAKGTLRGQVTLPPGRGGLAPVQFHRVQLISASFDPATNLHEAFRASHWPSNEANLQVLMENTIETFVAYIAET